MKANELLAYLALITRGDRAAIINHIRQKTPVNFEEVTRVAAGIPTKYVTLVDEDYPSAFKDLANPPLTLFYRGNLALLSDSSRCVSFIGTRKPSSYGLQMARTLAGGYASRGGVVVSGLASGIDGECLRAALPYGKGVAILGNGLGYYYPNENRDLQKQLETDGLVITEYPFDVGPAQAHFPTRNRLIAACSCALSVIEAHPHSGTAITVAEAMAIGRDIGAVPFHADEESICNMLIQEGAMMLQNADDIYHLLDWRSGYRYDERQQENLDNDK